MHTGYGKGKGKLVLPPYPGGSKGICVVFVADGVQRSSAPFAAFWPLAAGQDSAQLQSRPERGEEELDLGGALSCPARRSRSKKARWQ